jgi:hypothetical protein
MDAPQRYVQWINEHLGFNPRSQKISDAFAEYIVADLRSQSPKLDQALATGAARVELNYPVRTRVAERDVDLVVIVPTVVGPLGVVQAAVENKTIMTAHGKARKNRYGDLIAYANHLHNHSPKAIAAATVVVNASAAYRNPDPFAASLVRRSVDMDRVLSDTIRIFAEIPRREQPDEPNDQPEAVAVVVVEYDGENPAHLVTAPPAPQPGQPIHYGEAIRRIARLYDARF